MTIQNETQVGEANYLELAKLYQTDFSNRRSLEWQLSLGLWGGLAAFAYAFAGKAEAQNKASTKAGRV